MFFDDDLPKLKQEEIRFPRNIEDMSISELEKYIIELENEIDRVKADIKKKQAFKDAAASFFK